MNREQPNYLSYLLRLWREDGNEMLHPVDEALDHPEGMPTWLASLESSLSGQRRGFANLDGLFAFLRRQTGTESKAKADEANMEG